MEVLESDNLGCQSRIGKQDPTLFSAYYRRTVWNLRQERKFVDLCLDKFKQILANEDKDQPATQNTEALSTVIPLVECVWKLCDNEYVICIILRRSLVNVMRLVSIICFRISPLKL